MDRLGDVLTYLSGIYLLREQRIGIRRYANGDTLCIHIFDMNYSNTSDHTCQH